MLRCRVPVGATPLARYRTILHVLLFGLLVLGILACTEPIVAPEEPVDSPLTPGPVPEQSQTTPGEPEPPIPVQASVSADAQEPEPQPVVPVPPTCTGEYAYLHGDLWPYWYNMRVACDPEHRAWWRCERIEGTGAPACAGDKDRYEHCIAEWNGGHCMAGVYAPSDTTGCWVCPEKWPQGRCDTRTFDYDAPEIWGTYYGVQWSSHTNLHRFLTLKVQASDGGLIAAFSSCPGDEECYMKGLDNHGPGPAPQGSIQTHPDEDRFTARFGSFACIRLPGNTALTLKASWMNEFCHTCAEDYPSFPHTPCWTADLPFTFEAGYHYLWTERGIERLPGCAGPPEDLAARFPEARCSTE